MHFRQPFRTDTLFFGPIIVLVTLSHDQRYLNSNTYILRAWFGNICTYSGTTVSYFSPLSDSVDGCKLYIRSFLLYNSRITIESHLSVRLLQVQTYLHVTIFNDFLSLCDTQVMTLSRYCNALCLTSHVSFNHTIVRQFASVTMYNWIENYC